jgi:hypothetical protein
VSRRKAHALFITFPVANASTIGALHSEIDGIAAALTGCLQCICGYPIPRTVIVWAIVAASWAFDGFANVVTVENTEHGIYAGSPLKQFGAVTLNEASRHNDTFDVAGVFAFDGFVNGVDGLLFGTLKEAAGVYDNGVSGVVICDKFAA